MFKEIAAELEAEARQIENQAAGKVGKIESDIVVSQAAKRPDTRDASSRSRRDPGSGPRIPSLTPLSADKSIQVESLARPAICKERD